MTLNPKREAYDGFNPNFEKEFGWNTNNVKEKNDDKLPPPNPTSANPDAINVPGDGKTPETKQPEVTVAGAEKSPSSTDKKEEKKADAPAVKKVLPKTSAVK